jgi:ATP-dependent DNA ligase
LRRSFHPGFIISAQPVERVTPPAGPDWVHEIKHDGYRLLVRKDGAVVRLFTRNGYDWSGRFLAVIEGIARSLKQKQFGVARRCSGPLERSGFFAI